MFRGRTGPSLKGGSLKFVVSSQCRPWTLASRWVDEDHETCGPAHNCWHSCSKIIGFNGKITTFNGKIHDKWQFSIEHELLMLVNRNVMCTTAPRKITISMGFQPSKKWVVNMTLLYPHYKGQFDLSSILARFTGQ